MLRITEFQGRSISKNNRNKKELQRSARKNGVEFQGVVKNEVEFQGCMTSKNGYPTISGKAHFLYEEMGCAFFMDLRGHQCVGCAFRCIFNSKCIRSRNICSTRGGGGDGGPSWKMPICSRHRGLLEN